MVHPGSLRCARWLGYTGALPFVVPMLMLHFAPSAFSMLDWRGLLADYGAVILSFVGALHWGFAARDATAGAESRAGLLWSVIPALYAWGALQFPPAEALRLLAVGLVFALMVDHALSARTGFPRWLLQLRAPLTLTGSTCLLLGSFA